MLRWTQYLEKVEVIKGRFGEIGAISHLHYLAKGRSYILEDRLISYEEKKRISSQVTGEGMNIRVETNFNSFPNSTEIMMKWDGKPKSMFTRILFRLMKKKIISNAEQELITFKGLVEKYGFEFPE